MTNATLRVPEIAGGFQNRRGETPPRRVFWFVAVLFFFWPASQAVAAAGLADLDKYTSRFYVVHTNLTKAQAVEFGAHMDLVYASFSKQFRALRGKKQRPQNLYLLRSHQDYQQTLRELGFDGTGTGGVFFWGDRTGLATWVEGKPRNLTLAVLQHEGFHQFAHARLGAELPVWLNEGLAEYFEHAIVVKQKVRTGIIDGDRLDAVRRAVDTNTAIAFDDLLNTTHAQWNGFVTSGVPRGGLQYAQSWLIVHFLVHGDNGRYRKVFGNYLVELSNGRDHTTAFRNAFGTLDTAPFAQRWLGFLKKAEPDNFSEAVKRVQFLAAGMVKTYTDERGWPTTFEALQDRLQEEGFKLEYQNESGQQTLSADDPKWYAYVDDEGNEQAFMLRDTPTPTRRGRRATAGGDHAKPLPPTLVAAGLVPEVHLTWEHDETGRTTARVKYPSARRRR